MPEVAAVVDSQVQAFVARDVERFVAHYSPDAVVTDPSGAIMAEGHEAIRAMYGGLFENSPDLAAKVTNRIVVGDFVADHEQLDGFVMPGSPTSIQAIAVYQVTDGKISRVGLYF